MSASSRERAEALEREVVESEAALEVSRYTVEALARERARLMDLLGERTEEIPLAPLGWTLLATALALVAGFLTYLITLLALSSSYGPDSDTPTAAAFWFVSSVVSAVALRVGDRPGAGGAARRGLRRLSYGLLVLSALIGGGVLGFAYLAQ